MAEITRSDFKAAIAAGLEAAPRLTAEAARRLRVVGRSASESAVGTFTGCPYDQARIYPRGERVIEPYEWDFINAYDAAVRELLSSNKTKHFKVVDS